MKKTFWDRWAWLYDRFMKKDARAYKLMYQMIRPMVREKTVLELAAGTGMIARNIAASAKIVEATDYSPEMIAEAKKVPHSSKIHFSVQDMFHLPYADNSFEVIIVSNALHIVPEPEKALHEIGRVLTEDGVLIAPTFVHGKISAAAMLQSRLMRLVGFPLQQKWSADDYHHFLTDNGWHIEKAVELKASFPLAYVACRKTEKIE